MLKSKFIVAAISMLIALGVLSSEPLTHAILEEGYTITDLKNEIDSGLNFETERLIITPTKTEDLDKLAEYLLNPNVTKYLDSDPDSAVSQGFKNKDEALKYLEGKKSNEEQIEEPSEESFGYKYAMDFTIKLKDSNDPIGKLDLMVYCYDEKYFFGVGYWLGEEFQRKGYMKEACFEVCNVAFKASDVKMAFISCDQKNIGSKVLAEKIFSHIQEVNSGMTLSVEKEEGTVGDFSYFRTTIRKK